MRACSEAMDFNVTFFEEGAILASHLSKRKLILSRKANQSRDCLILARFTSVLLSSVWWWTTWVGRQSEAVKENERKRERERLLCWFFSFMTSLDTLSLLFVDGVSLRGKEAPSIRLFREMEWRPRRQKALEREWEKGYSSPLLFVERFANLLFPHRPTDRPKYLWPQTPTMRHESF